MNKTALQLFLATLVLTGCGGGSGGSGVGAGGDTEVLTVEDREEITIPGYHYTYNPIDSAGPVPSPYESDVLADDNLMVSNVDRIHPVNPGGRFYPEDFIEDALLLTEAEYLAPGLDIKSMDFTVSLKKNSGGFFYYDVDLLPGETYYLAVKFYGAVGVQKIRVFDTNLNTEASVAIPVVCEAKTIVDPCSNVSKENSVGSISGKVSDTPPNDDNFLPDISSITPGFLTNSFNGEYGATLNDSGAGEGRAYGIAYGIVESEAADQKANGTLVITNNAVRGEDVETRTFQVSLYSEALIGFNFLVTDWRSFFTDGSK